jgi:hypothetical protein
VRSQAGSGWTDAQDRLIDDLQHTFDVTIYRLGVEGTAFIDALEKRKLKTRMLWAPRTNSTALTLTSIKPAC